MRNMSFGRCVGAVAGVIICGVLLIGSRAANAAGTLSLSTNTVNIGTGQVININISGSDQVRDTNFFVQVNDGGTVNGGVATKPIITGLDVTTGIFAGDNTGNTFNTNGSLIAGAATNTNPPSGATTVSDNGVLAKLTLDTTGMTNGSTFTIRFDNVGANAGGPFATRVDDVNTQPITLSGAGLGSTATITVVPEPVAASLMLLGIGGLALRRSRR